MGRYSGGYTLIEVMIVIAITGLLFISAVLVFEGEQDRTGFSQAMQDINSAFQNYASQISAGNYAGSSNYSCDASSGTPVIQTPASGTAANSQCVFLGRAFQPQPNGGLIKGFTVVGTRDVFSGTTDTGTPATTINQATPTLAAISGSPILEEDYNLEEGATLLSSKVNGTEYDLVAIYNNLQATSGATGSAANNLLIKPYNCISSAACSTPTQVANCINGTTGGCNSVNYTSQWLMCFQSDNGSQTAQLEIDNATSGLITKLTYVSCS